MKMGSWCCELLSCLCLLPNQEVGQPAFAQIIRKKRGFYILMTKSLGAWRGPDF